MFLLLLDVAESVTAYTVHGSHYLVGVNDAVCHTSSNSKIYNHMSFI